MPQRVRITDVSPRDGLQNEPRAIPAHDKLRLIAGLLPAGLDEIEVTSFVSPRWIPQLGDAAEVLRGLAAHPAHQAHAPGPRPLLSALVPNEQGLDAALRANDQAAAHHPHAPAPLLGKVSVFAAASETFSRKNTNGSIAEVLARFAPVIPRAHAAGLLVRGYISTVIACPFEGPIAPDAVAAVAHRLIDAGVDELDLGDTIGAATPETVRAMLAAVVTQVGPAWLAPDRLTLHLHDTFGHAAACVVAALDAGVRSFDASVAGLGGCPYASVPGRRAPGNIATDLLLRTIEHAGFTTTVDPAAVAHAATIARQLTAPSDLRDGAPA